MTARLPHSCEIYLPRNVDLLAQLPAFGQLELSSISISRVRTPLKAVLDRAALPAQLPKGWQISRPCSLNKLLSQSHMYTLNGGWWLIFWQMPKLLKICQKQLKFFGKYRKIINIGIISHPWHISNGTRSGVWYWHYYIGLGGIIVTTEIHYAWVGHWQYWNPMSCGFDIVAICWALLSKAKEYRNTQRKARQGNFFCPTFGIIWNWARVVILLGW